MKNVKDPLHYAEGSRLDDEAACVGDDDAVEEVQGQQQVPSVIYPHKNGEIYLTGNLTRVHGRVIYISGWLEIMCSEGFWPGVRSSLTVAGHPIYSPCLFRCSSDIYLLSDFR